MGDEPHAVFLPWIVFAVVARVNGQGLTWAAIGALVAAIAVLNTRRDHATGLNDVMTRGAIAWFAGMALAGLVLPHDGWFALNARAVSAAGFTTIAIGSLAFRPWTEFFTRVNARPRAWETPAFKRVNVVLSMLWALAFALIAAGHLAAAWIDTPPAFTVFNWVVPIAIAAVALHRSRVLWDDYVESDREQAEDATRGALWDLSLDWTHRPADEDIA